jgi:hypothetical protein
VVDGRTRTLVVARVLGVFEVADVPDVGCWMAVCGRAAALDFIVFVVHDEVFLVLGVEDPALVRVGGAFVGCDGDDLGELLVGDVVCDG